LISFLSILAFYRCLRPFDPVKTADSCAIVTILGDEFETTVGVVAESAPLRRRGEGQ
jgi:hypothetical protein